MIISRESSVRQIPGYTKSIIWEQYNTFLYNFIYFLYPPSQISNMHKKVLYFYTTLNETQ